MVKRKSQKELPFVFRHHNMAPPNGFWHVVLRTSCIEASHELCRKDTPHR